MTEGITLRPPETTRIKSRRRLVSRRAAIKRGALYTAGGIAAAGGLAGAAVATVHAIGKAIEHSQRPAPDTHVTIENDQVVPSPDNKPQPVKIVFVPQQGSTTEYNQGKIVVRSIPRDGQEKTDLLSPSEFRTNHAVRVIGGTYGHYPPPPEKNLGAIIFNNKSQGVWFKLTDPNGQPVNPRTGALLGANEKPSYVAAAFLTVASRESRHQRPQNPQTPQPSQNTYR